MNYLSGIADAALSAVGVENKALLIAAPGAIVIGLGLGSRVAAGTLAIGAKGTSKAANAIGFTNLSQKFDSAGDSLGTFATRSIKTELKLAVGFTALAAAGFAASTLMAEPEITNFEKFTNFIGLTTPAPTYWKNFTDAVSSVASSIKEQAPGIARISNHFAQ